MIKRIKYISRSSRPMTEAEILEISKTSVKNNKPMDITGVLVEVAGIFFQVIEGPSAAVDALYTRIQADTRHTEILLVNTMENCETRMFPQWAMKTVRVASDDIRAEAIKLLLETAVEAHARLELLSNGVERFVWAEMTGNPVQTLESTSD